MSRKNRPWILAAGVLATALFTAGCFFGDDERSDDADLEEVREGLNEAAEGLGRAAEAMRDAFEGMAEGASVEEPINFREFYEFLPEEIGNFTRTSLQGKTEGVAGWDVSTAEARYENEDGGRIEVEIVDLGALPISSAIGSFVEWADYNVDEETDRGWRRTLEYEGFPAIESFTRTRSGDLGRAEFHYLVVERFSVKINGRNVTMDDVYDVRDEIGADDLEDMKDREG